MAGCREGRRGLGGRLDTFRILIRLVGLVLLAALSLTAAPPPRKVIVGINRDYPPYEYLDAQGRPAGFDVDLVRAVAEVANLELEFRADTWDATLTAFREGRVDVLPGLLYSRDREAFAGFSSPYLVVHYALFTRRGEGGFSGLEGLQGRKVLVERQSQMHHHLEAAGLGGQLILVSSEPEAIRRLARGEGDAAAAPQLEGLVLAKAEGLPLETVGGALFTRQLCLATRIGEEDLLSKLNTGLTILNQTGRFAEIYQEWFGSLGAESGVAKAAIRRVLMVLGIVVAALVLVVAWSWFLRRQVAQATERLRLANREIREREAFLNSVVENLPLAIFGKDPRKGYAFTLWNAQSERTFGLRKEEILGKTDYDFFPREQSDFFRAKDEEVVRERRVLDIAEERITTATEGEILLHTRKVPLFDEAGDPYLLLGITENITDRKALEEGMRQTQKLESLGVLAGGIAHDFNNLLTAILGNLSLIAMREEEGGSLQPYLANAEATTLRAAELTRQMLAYAGRGEIRVRPLDLSLAASDMATLLKVSISKKVALTFAFAEGLPPILADSAQLQQVVMNLVTNASEAIGDAEGEIRVATGFAQLEPQHLSQLHVGSPVPAGTYVTLSVRDTGSGMPPEVLSRIFDPFFTTKFSGRGLGLSAMLGILRAHGAGIRIHSEPGQGSEFRIYFPPCAEAPGANASAQAGQDAASSPRGRGTVLVVDDEPEVRSATADLLREAGYDVLEAVDGLDACESYARQADRIDVVLMDLTMPRMDGRTAALRIMDLDQQARVLLTSGFPVNVGTQGAPAEGLAGFIPKPYRMKDLVAALQRAMEGR